MTAAGIPLTAASARRVERPRAPGLFMGVSSAAIFALVATVALTARSASPPTVAELAPQARDMTETNEDLASSGTRTGAGSSAGSDPTTTTTTTTPLGTADPDTATAGGPPPVDVARVRRCVGDPARQIEDPQSPPCVPYFAGDNGGATTPGVTGTEIRIAVGNYLGGDAGVNFNRYIKLYERFFNNRFEFYGRRLNLIPYSPAPPASTAVRMRADAVKVHEELGAFAATQYSEQDGRHYVFYDALAERGIIGVLMGSGGMSHIDEAHLRRHAPYQWDYTPSADRLLQGYGEFLCNVLAKKPAAYARPPQSTAAKRTFGVIVDTGFQDTPPLKVEPLKQALAACGETLAVVEYGGGGPAATIMLALRDKGVTDVLYTGQVGILALHLMPQASAQGFHPEWLVWNFGYQDSDSAALFFPKDQQRSILGLQVYNKTLRPQDMPYMWAAKEIDPTASEAADRYERLYKSLLLLASGIQMAGPNLTPTTFERALLDAQFPNPGASGPPYYQARVGFPGVHTMQQDLSMVWLSASDVGPETGLAPSFCYALQGVRFGLGKWPRQDVPFFTGPCR